MSIADNIAAPVLDKLCPNHILDTKKISEYTEKFVQSFHIVLGSVKNKPGSLSGGNQQKVMLSIFRMADKTVNSSVCIICIDPLESFP